MSDVVSLNSKANLSGDVIRPFQLEVSSLRGRIVRLDKVLDNILDAHAYPQIVSQLLAETVTLCALLSSMLKYDGVFTLQTHGDGPIGMLVADMSSDGAIRGCASFDAERVFNMQTDILKSKAPLTLLLGKGHIAFTVDQGDNTDRYQGIVELRGKSLTECVQHYFTQSEQIDTGIKIAVNKEDKNWRAAGIMLQHMPEEGGEKSQQDSQRNSQEKSIKPPPISNRDEDDWQRAMVFLESCKEEELLSEALHGHDILIRLFHEEGVRVFDPIKLRHECRCSIQKVENIVRMMSQEEREDMANENNLSMTCEFCSKEYILSDDILKPKPKQTNPNA